ncbi:MAG: hotdog fold thioesterase [Cyclobacteriaceae bacterium]|nr:hotdog fold thioesterase [Cyclobacteriaceae bacterium]
MFNEKWTLDRLNKMSKNNMTGHLGIEFIEIGKDFLKARMPVDERTCQPYGILHGGASVTLAETIGSVSALMCIDDSKYFCVGMEINANHLRKADSGYVVGKSIPLHVGRKSQVWQIEITNSDNKLVCISRITMSVIEKGNEP